MSELLILALAVFRVSYMVAREEGPGMICANFRQAVEQARIKRDTRRLKAGLDAIGPGHFERGINCPLCISFWLAMPVALTYLTGWYAHPVLWFIYLFLALSAFTVITTRIIK